MGNYIMVVQSRARPGCDEQYNAWYDGGHLDDICSIPGVTGARRFEALPAFIGQPGLPYLAIYEIETEEPNGVLQELQLRADAGTLKVSDALDAEATILWMYRART